MKLESKDLIEEFYEEIIKEFPGYTLEQVKEICNLSYEFIKVQMAREELPRIHWKYLGTFQVYKGRAENMLYNLKERFKFNKINPKQYFKLKEMLEKYLENYEEEI